MRKNLKKLSATFLIVSAACLALTGCEVKKGVNNSTPATSQGQETSASNAQNGSQTPSGSAGLGTVNPADPSAPVNPTTPADPSAPVNPTTPADPSAPVNPTTPATPEQPASEPQESVENPSNATETPAEVSKSPETPAQTLPETTTGQTDESSPEAPAASSSAPAIADIPLGPGPVIRTEPGGTNPNATMNNPVLELGSEELNNAVNSQISTQNTALLEQYAKAYPQAAIDYRGNFIDSKGILYTFFYADYTEADGQSFGTKMFTRIYDLNAGGAPVRLSNLYDPNVIANTLLTANLDEYRPDGLDAGIWEAQKAALLSNDQAALAGQLAQADFGSDNPGATIFSKKVNDQLLTIYYPVSHELGDYAAFSIPVE